MKSEMLYLSHPCHGYDAWEGTYNHKVRPPSGMFRGLLLISWNYWSLFMKRSSLRERIELYSSLNNGRYGSGVNKYMECWEPIHRESTISSMVRLHPLLGSELKTTDDYNSNFRDHLNKNGSIVKWGRRGLGISEVSPMADGENMADLFVSQQIIKVSNALWSRTLVSHRPWLLVDWLFHFGENGEEQQKYIVVRFHQLTLSSPTEREVFRGVNVVG